MRKIWNVSFHDSLSCMSSAFSILEATRTLPKSTSRTKKPSRKDGTLSSGKCSSWILVVGSRQAHDSFGTAEIDHRLPCFGHQNSTTNNRQCPHHTLPCSNGFVGPLHRTDPHAVLFSHVSHQFSARQSRSAAFFYADPAEKPTCLPFVSTLDDCSQPDTAPFQPDAASTGVQTNGRFAIGGHPASDSSFAE